MITLNNISKIIEGEYLLKDINFTINPTDKLAIVGQNGTGKTTLLNIIIDDDNATTGVVINSGAKLGYLKQNNYDVSDNTFSFEINKLKQHIFNIEKEINEIAADINFATDSNLQDRYAFLFDRYNILGGYEIDGQISRLLYIFGLDKIDANQHLKDLSGGEKTKLELIKLLFEDFDYLLLDEPTNHLDIDAITWLESYLKAIKKGVILISHDRYFLNEVTNRIIDINNEEIENYNCSYNEYLNEKVIRYEYKVNEYKNMLAERRDLEEFITKWRGTPSKIPQVNDRKNKLARIEQMKEPKNITNHIHFELEGYRLKKYYYVDLVDATIGIDTPLITNADFKVHPGEKVCIMGPNGCGKTTLLRTIMKEIMPLSGNVIVNHNLKVGYFKQNLEVDETKTVYELLAEAMDDFNKMKIRRYLAQFCFVKEDVNKQIKSLSGGEKMRVNLALLTLNSYDMILLDEPTNHLDVESKEMLESVLQNFPGTLVIVSHDRFFINEVVDKIVYIDPTKHLVEIKGNYDNYKQYTTIVKEEKKTKVAKPNLKVQNKENKKLEREITKLETKKDELIALTSLEEYYMDYNKLNEVKEKVEVIENDLEELYMRFLEM